MMTEKEYIERGALMRKECPMRHANGNCLPCGGFCTAVIDPICEAMHNAYYMGKKPTADMREVRHAYWTGLTTRDRAQAEGVPWWTSDEEKEEYRDWFSNYTHCSNCMAGYDGRKIKHIKYCNFCGARMDGGKGE